jgi:tetratricopeptide (TPR) repeat protein
LKLDKPEQAEKSYLEALKINPTWAVIYGSLGDLYYKKQNFDKAIENYKQAVNYESGNYLYHLSLGKSYDKKGNTEPAIQEYIAAVSAKPSDAESHYLLGSLYMAKQDYQKAYEEVKRASELEPKSKLYKETLASVQAKVPQVTPTPVIITSGTPTPVMLTPGNPTPVILSPVNPTPTPGNSVSVNLSMKILEPKGTGPIYEFNGPKVNIVGIATAPGGIVEVLIDNVPASLSQVTSQYSSEIPQGGNSLLFQGDALLTIGDNQVKISAMDKTRTRIEMVITIRRNN